MSRVKWSRLSERLWKRPHIIILVAPCLLMLALYIVSGREFELERFSSLGTFKSEDELADGYLVWNSKCRMLSKDPNDWSIKKYVMKKKFQACSSEPLMSYVTRDPINGSFVLSINKDVMKAHKNSICCWAPITRPVPFKPLKEQWDTTIRIGKFKDFVEQVTLPSDIEIVMITCRKGKKTIYENIHAIIMPAKVQDRLDEFRSYNESGSTDSEKVPKKRRKLSVLVLGVDSVSRLNFKRSMPKTERLFRDNDWFHLQGYNKMGENTFPNLMAILTGQTNSEVYKNCNPVVPYALDNCPILWYNYRNASYITAYGEDLAEISTFNYHKVGFVQPPTDYYLRPYILATEERLKSKKLLGTKYCTGPELSAERIFNYAIEFSRTFMGLPYFGFFWTNSISHEDVNGISSMDDRWHDMFVKMAADGIMDDAMIVFLSDHGTRWGNLRQTSIGWYEDRLPFIYLRLPGWFRDEEPNAYQALRVNENRLTSPYDLYETLRDILLRSGGGAVSSTGCPTCQSLLKPVPLERGCSDAGITPQWCACRTFKRVGTSDKIAVKGARKFLDHIENIIKNYRDKKANRLCSKLKLQKIHRVDRLLDLREANNFENATVTRYFYLIEVTPGGGLFETTVYYDGADGFTIKEDETGRINSYAADSTCLDYGSKRYCHCIRR